MKRIALRKINPYFDVDSNQVRCPGCLGAGEGYTDNPDPVEGHKMNRKGTCTLCLGSCSWLADTPLGGAALAFWNTFARLYDAEEQKEKDRLALQKQLVEEAKQALSPEQYKALEKHIIGKPRF